MAQENKLVKKRQGSPWKGLWAVIGKEMADHLTSARMRILEILIVLTAVGTGYTALRQISNANLSDEFLFLRLFTTAKDPLPAFAGFLGFLVPLVSIALVFDTLNREFSNRTISRMLSQPIYRDALLLGKFLGAFFTLALVLTAIWLLIYGIGLLGLGIPPSGVEVARSLIFLLVTIAYGGFWLALGLLFSTVFKQAATAALASIGVWLFFIAFWDMLVNLIAQGLAPIRFGFLNEIMAQARVNLFLSRLSPNTLFIEATMGVLNPTVRSLGLLLPSELEGAVMGTPLPVGQTFVMIWPHLTGLIAASILLFAFSYISFQRREIRA